MHRIILLIVFILVACFSSPQSNGDNKKIEQDKRKIEIVYLSNHQTNPHNGTTLTVAYVDDLTASVYQTKGSDHVHFYTITAQNVLDLKLGKRINLFTGISSSPTIDFHSHRIEIQVVLAE